MPKKTLRSFMPHPDRIRGNKTLSMLGPWMHQSNLWHLNRRSAAGALALGVLIAWVPIPFQMLLSGSLAVVIGVNLPLSVAAVWITNPLTMPPMFYGAYLIGSWVLGWERMSFQFKLSWTWLADSLNSFGPPFLLGCLILGIVSSLITYLVISNLWRYSVLFDRRKRRAH